MKIENPRINSTFSKKKSRYGIDLRNYEKKKNEVKFAKTNRLKHLSIPYMQRILNSENIEFGKQDLKRKMNFNEVKNIKKRIRLY